MSHVAFAINAQRWIGAGAVLCALAALARPSAAAGFPKFEAQEIDHHAGAIVYAVTIADVNGDRKPDVVALTEDAALWYENPNWSKHEIIHGSTERDNVCIQPALIDEDGRIDFALGAGWRPPDTKNPATLQWLGRDAKGNWQVHPIQFNEPMVHRMRWGWVRSHQKQTDRKQLAVAPLQGRGTKGPDWGAGKGARVLLYSVPRDPHHDVWPVELVDQSLHAIHNLQLVDLDGDNRDEIVLAAWEGVFILRREGPGQWEKTRVGSGDQASKPFKGASEVKVGLLRDGGRYIATIEPWHGHQVVVYTPSPASAYNRAAEVKAVAAVEGAVKVEEPARSEPEAHGKLWSRQVIANPLKWGHALWCADLDGDGDDEIVIGQRDPNAKGAQGPRGPGVFVFDPAAKSVGGNALAFERHTIDDGGMACEDALAEDLDGDGRPEIIAGGRATHNVKIYWNRGH